MHHCPLQVRLNLMYLLLILMGSSIWGVTGFGQTIKSSTKESTTAEAVITFQMVDKSEGILTRIPLDKLNGRIDLDKYSNAEIHISVNVETIYSYQGIKVCAACYPSKTTNGFSLYGSSKEFLFTQGGARKVDIIYKLDASKIKVGKKSTLDISLEFIDKSDLKKVSSPWYFKSVPFEVVSKKLSRVILPPEEEKRISSSEMRILKNELRDAIYDKKYYQIEKICKQVNDYKKKDIIPEGQLYLEHMKQMCEKAIKDRERKAQEDATWDEVKRKVNRDISLSERKHIYRDYIKNSPNSYYKTNAIAAIKQLQEELESLSEEDLKAKDKELRFAIKEKSYKLLGDKVEIVIQYQNTYGRYPSLTFCEDEIVKVKKEREEEKEVVLLIKQGEECLLEATFMDGVTNLKELTTFLLSGKERAMKVNYSPQKDGGVLLTVEGGHPPFQLRLLQNNITQGVIDDIKFDENRQFLLPPGHEVIPIKGAKYVLELVDAYVKSKPEARSEELILGQVDGKKDAKRTALLLLVVVIGVIGYLLYKKYQL